ncbi:hypothetical protein BM221_003322 [Beauveria bassiana]|uniref:Uncharacterized protein n=1 Tax=Beauveria bassiana TaxID=176275 RepID=A0A2N6NUB6_BEABA|nr:hypothetical protein BM221_003322 [Beauveria bassiana]
MARASDDGWEEQWWDGEAVIWPTAPGVFDAGGWSGTGRGKIRISQGGGGGMKKQAWYGVTT